MKKMQLMYFDMLKSIRHIGDLCEYPLKITLAKLHFQTRSPDPCISSFLKIINLPQKSDVLKARNQKSIIAAFVCVCVCNADTHRKSVLLDLYNDWATLTMFSSCVSLSSHAFRQLTPTTSLQHTCSTHFIVM